MKFYRSFGMLALMVLSGLAQAQPLNPIGHEALLGYLDQMTQWQREVSTVEPSSATSRELVYRDTLSNNATDVLKSGFGFLRSVAKSDAIQPQAPSANRETLMQRAKEIKQHIAELQAQQGRSKGGARVTIADQLRLERARQELVATILANMNSASSQSPDRLLYTIDSLSRSIPELNENARPVKRQQDMAKAPRPVGSILGLTVALFDTTRKARELDELVSHTAELKDQSMALMKQLRASLGEPSAESDKDDAPVIAMTIDERVAAYQRVGAHIVPLAETMRAIDSSRQTLKEWRDVLRQQRESVLRRLGVAIGVLLVTLAVPLVISELTRRATKRISDPKRKRQLKTIRRILTGVAVVFIVLLNFISDFSSFATFAGFLTAGLAVALQSVLLSLVGHFLFYGRYGIRNGDRVHVAGVTGDVVQIGMVRFYMRELHETDHGLEPTGKVVAFPNSIVFQNVAFYKYAG